jgi:hypothetical protein
LLATTFSISLISMFVSYCHLPCSHAVPSETVYPPLRFYTYFVFLHPNCRSST